MKTKYVTQAVVIAAAKRKWTDHEIDLRVHKQSPVGADREALIEKRKVDRAREAELTELLKADSSALDDLLIACEFWRDVNGGEPSSSQLREATARARRHIDMRDERRDIKEELNANQHLFAWRRYELLVRRKGGFGWTIVANCDTLEDALSSLESFAKERV